MSVPVEDNRMLLLDHVQSTPSPLEDQQRPPQSIFSSPLEMRIEDVIRGLRPYSNTLKDAG